MNFRPLAATLCGTLLLAPLPAQPQSTAFAECAPVAHAETCQCSVVTVETMLTFAEAAMLIQIHYKDDPDEYFERLMGELLQSCTFGLPRRPAASFTMPPHASATGARQ